VNNERLNIMMKCLQGETVEELVQQGITHVLLKITVEHKTFSTKIVRVLLN